MKKIIFTVLIAAFTIMTANAKEKIDNYIETKSLRLMK